MKEIKLIGKHANGRTTKVSDEDYEEMSKYKWHCVRYKNHNTDYVGRYNPLTKRTSYMHRQLLGLTNPKVIGDHVDGDGLNNQRDNIRIATHGQNMANRKASGASNYLGVFPTSIKKKEKVYNYWLVVCIKEGRAYRACRKTEKDAAIAYNELALKYHGKFARLNKIE